MRERSRGILVCLALFLSVLLMISFVEAKFIDGQFQLRSEDPEAFLGKFAFSDSVAGSISGQIKITEVPTTRTTQYPPVLTAALFDDDGWNVYLREKYAKCSERLRYATELFPIPVHRHNTTAISEFTHTLTKPRKSRRAHHTYVIVSACNMEFSPNYPPPFDFDITFLNGESHLPADEEGTTTFFTLVLVVLFLALAGFIWGITSIRKKYQQLHLVSIIVGFSLLLQIGACIAQLIHLYKYIDDGKGYKLRHTWVAVDFLAEMTQLGSELLIAFVLVCIALGWLFSDSFKMAKLLFSPKPQMFFAILVLTHVFLQYKGRRYFEDFNHFHDFSHWPGFLLVLLRLSLCFIFWVGTGLSQGILPEFLRKNKLYGAIFGTIFGLVSRQAMTASGAAPSAASGAGARADSSVETQPMMGVFQGNSDGYIKDADPDVVKILAIVTGLGTLWFLSFPLLVLTAPLFAAVDQKAYVGWGSLIVHVVVMLFLLYSFAFPNSAFFKHSTLKNLGTVFAGGGMDFTSNPGAAAGGKLSFLKKAAID